MTEQFSNQAQSVLANSISAGATTITVASAANFPTSGQFRIVVDQEIFLVTAVSGNVFTVVAGYEGTSQAAHSSGAVVAHILTAGVISQVYNQANNFITPRIQAFGDSRASYCGLNVSQTSSTFSYLSTQYPNRSPLAWANRFLRARLNLDLSLGYVGAFQGVCSVKVINGGSNYTSPSVSFSGTGTGLTFGTPVVSGGVIQSVPITSQGINFTGLPNLTVTDSTGSGAQLQAIMGGTGTFGVAGETSTQCINRLADIIAAPIDVVFVTIGTNDLTGGISASTTKANLKTIFDTLIAAGKFVIFCPDQARSYWASLNAGQIISARKQLYDVKHWVYKYALIINNINSSTSRKFFICDGEDFWVDATSSTGNPLSIMTSDGLHWSTASVQAMGLRLAQQLAPLLGLNNNPPANIVSQVDAYDATYNPEGVLNFGWLMNATTGSPNSPLTGTRAGNFTAYRSSGSATGTMACSVETTRTDGLSGNRQVFTFSIGGGSSTELFGFGIVSTAISSYNISIGDNIIAECDMWLSGHANVNKLQLQISFLNSGGTTLIQAIDGDNNTDTFIAGGAYMAINGDVTPMTFKTPPITVPANTTNVTFGAMLGFNASGAAGSATATWKIGNFRIHKVY